MASVAGKCVVKIFFNRHGKAERTSLMLSSGNKDRDAECIRYCKGLTIPIPRIGTRAAAELWRTLSIAGDAVLPGPATPP